MSTELSRKIDNAKTTAVTPATQIKHAIDRMLPELQKALPKNLTPEKFARAILTQIRINPRLLSCSVDSLLTAMLESAQLGLEPTLGKAHLVPYKTECKFIIGYQGMIELAYRTGEVANIQARVIHANDKFEFEDGFEPRLSFVPNWGNPGEAVGGFAFANLKNGARIVEIMSREQIDSIRDRSAAWKRDKSGPWATDYEEMARKTLVRRLFKFLPKTSEVVEILQSDDNVTFTGRAETMQIMGGSLGEAQETFTAAIEESKPCEASDLQISAAQANLERRRKVLKPEPGDHVIQGGTNKGTRIADFGVEPLRDILTNPTAQKGLTETDIDAIHDYLEQLDFPDRGANIAPKP